MGRSGRSTGAPTFALALLTLACSGCDLGPRILLAVDLQTDVAPTLEFTSIRVRANDAMEGRMAEAGESFLTGRRVAEMLVSPGTVRLSVELLDPGGAVVGERTMHVDLRTDSVITVPIAASCRRVACPLEQTCIRGVCLAPESICDGAPCDGREDCPGGVCAPECDLDEECEPVDRCSRPRCSERVCLGVPVPGACPPHLYCSVALGCLTPPEWVDGGAPPDAAGVDGAVPVDAAADAGPSVDAGSCGPCTTLCGSAGQLACDADGEPTTTCVLPPEACTGRDDDCDGSVDEGLECNYEHDVVFSVEGSGVDAGIVLLVDRVTASTPGVVCAGELCGPLLTAWRTLPAPDGHVHTITGEVAFDMMGGPFVPPATTDLARGHRHDVSCSLPDRASVYYYDLEEPVDPTRYNMFCIGLTGPCEPMFGACTTR